MNIIHTHTEYLHTKLAAQAHTLSNVGMTPTLLGLGLLGHVIVTWVM